MDKVLKDQIIEYASNCMDLNPDKGSITAIKDAADFHDVELSPQEIDALALELLFEHKDLDF